MTFTSVTMADVPKFNAVFSLGDSAPVDLSVWVKVPSATVIVSLTSRLRAAISWTAASLCSVASIVAGI